MNIMAELVGEPDAPTPLCERQAEQNLDIAYGWLCRQRRTAPADADVWHLRYHWRYLRSTLLRSLLAGDYRLTPMCIVGKKKDAKAIWTAQDALVLKWVALCITPGLRLPTRCEHVKGHGGGVNSVARQTQAIRKAGYRWVCRTDIRGYYRHINKQRLLDQVNQQVPEPLLQDLIAQYVHYTVECGGEFYTPEKGICRGCALSPVMGALHLATMDEHFRVQMQRLGIYYARYMDDMVILAHTRWQLRRQVRALNGFFNAGGFEQHPDKTYIGKLAKGYDWMGAQISDAGVEGIAQRAKVNHGERLRRLYERIRTWPADARRARVQAYRLRWNRWARAYHAVSATLIIGLGSYGGTARAVGNEHPGQELIPWVEGGVIIDDGDGYAVPDVNGFKPYPWGSETLVGFTAGNASGLTEPSYLGVLLQTDTTWRVAGGGQVDPTRSRQKLRCTFSNGAVLNSNGALPLDTPFDGYTTAGGPGPGGMTLTGPALIAPNGSENDPIPSATCLLEIRLVLTGITGTSVLQYWGGPGPMIVAHGAFEYLGVPGRGSWNWLSDGKRLPGGIPVPHPVPATCTWSTNAHTVNFGTYANARVPTPRDLAVANPVSIGVTCSNPSTTPAATNATVSAWSDTASEGGAVNFPGAPGLQMRLMAPTAGVPGVSLGDGQSYGNPFLLGLSAGDARPLWSWALPAQTGAIATSVVPMVPVLQSTSEDWGPLGTSTATVTLTLTTQ